MLLVGVVIVAIPIALSFRTVMRLTRGLGAVDAAQVGAYVEQHPDDDLARLARMLETEAPGSIAHRLVTAVTDTDATTPLMRRLALAEAVADIERAVIDDVRVPRVAASLATTGGLLAAAIVMREGLGESVEGSGAEVAARFTSIIERGLTLVAIAILGGVVCAALHRSANRQRRARLDELDALTRPLAARVGGDP